MQCKPIKSVSLKVFSTMEFPPHSKNCKHNNHWCCQGMGLPSTPSQWLNTSDPGVTSSIAPSKTMALRVTQGCAASGVTSMKVVPLGLAGVVHGSNKRSHQHWKFYASTSLLLVIAVWPSGVEASNFPPSPNCWPLVPQWRHVMD